MTSSSLPLYIVDERTMGSVSTFNTHRNNGHLRISAVEITSPLVICCDSEADVPLSVDDMLIVGFCVLLVPSERTSVDADAIDRDSD